MDTRRRQAVRRAVVRQRQRVQPLGLEGLSAGTFAELRQWTFAGQRHVLGVAQEADVRADMLQLARLRF